MKNKERRPIGRAATACIAAWLAATLTSAFAETTLGQQMATGGNAKGVPACIGCHGAAGQGNADAGFPRLAGLSSSYLDAQLAAFADGSRKSAVMQPIASHLTASERTAVANYFSTLSLPQGIRSSDPSDPLPSDTGAWLATRGRWKDNLPACAQCHGPAGAGVGSVFPSLAGQPAGYIETQLHEWKAGARPAGPLALMPAVASKLSDVDMYAVAEYYAQPAQISETRAK
ncbi:c-type cytochrome [Paraburkholderia diazotrophica]|uniref:c-type cytochrome n=1 Tax=Paraburkholderia diazotrophica TaxID=667676 RepID=UPI00317D02F6